MNIENKILNIEFGSRIFDAIICLDADLPSIEFFDNFKNIPILAADGAAIRLYEMGITADYVIGDLDTFFISPIFNTFAQSKIIHETEQDTNDFEKTLNFARTKKYENLLIIGFHGGLLEHTLNNWSVFIRFAKKLNLCIYDKNRYALLIEQSIKLAVKKDEIISIIPQPKAIITTKNLYWSLNNEPLELGKREGARNIAISDYIEIYIHSGELLLFLDSRLPFSPVFSYIESNSNLQF